MALWRVETPRGTWRKRAADATKYTLGNATNATELVVWQPFPEDDPDSAGAVFMGRRVLVDGMGPSETKDGFECWWGELLPPSLKQPPAE